MRFCSITGFGLSLLLLPTGARADMSAAIAGSAPILPAFSTAKAVPAIRPMAPQAAGGDEDASSDASGPMPAAPLFDRRLSAEERTADISPGLAYALLRIEGVYDPTRVYGTEPTRMRIMAGTASMNNVFGDRWHLGDTDANVSYVVRYIAQAWQKGSAEPCGAYLKRRPSVDIVEVTSLGPDDCARIIGLQGPQDAAWTQLAIAAAPTSAPIFAAPEPGARMSSDAFWAAQKARIEAIKARIAFQRRRPATTLAADR